MIVKGVKCDEDGCGWIEKNARVEDWVKKPCPKCGEGEIINDAELFMLNALRVAEALSKLIAPFFPKKALKTVSVDVGPMRNGKPPVVKIKPRGLGGER